MQIRGQFSQFFFDTALPALNVNVWQGFKQKRSLRTVIFNIKNSTRSIEQFTQMAGVGLPGLIQENGDINVDNFSQGFPKNFIPLKYGLGIGASRELVEDDKFDIISKRSVALGRSINEAREIQAAAVLNNAFDATNYPIPDTKALCSATHPLLKGGVQSNLLAVAADLDPTSLELALTDWELWKTHEGFLQRLATPKVVVAAQNRWNLSEILKSQMRSDTANNTVNAFRFTENGDTLDGVVWPYLTDPDAWFLVAPPSDNELVWVDRKAPYTTDDYIEKSETGYVYMRYRADVGAYGPKGIYGTPGA